MGYTTEFRGQIKVDPPLNEKEIEYLKAFSDTRRMNRTRGPYFVGGSGICGQGQDSDILDYNSPDSSQPGLWCQWVPTADGAAIEWDGNEKFYHADLWMGYLVNHFVGSDPAAKSELSFLQGHVCNGSILAQGEDIEDRWTLVVKNNEVNVVRHEADEASEDDEKVVIISIKDGVVVDVEGLPPGYDYVIDDLDENP